MRKLLLSRLSVEENGDVNVALKKQVSDGGDILSEQVHRVVIEAAKSVMLIDGGVQDVPAASVTDVLDAVEASLPNFRPIPDADRARIAAFVALARGE